MWSLRMYSRRDKLLETVEIWMCDQKKQKASTKEDAPSNPAPLSSSI